MNIAAFLERAARTSPDRPAVARGDARWATFARLAGRVARLAAALRGRLGFARGDRVAIVMANAPEYAEALLALWWAGLVAVPVNAKLHPREIAWILGDCGARAVFATADLAAVAASAALEAGTDPAIFEAGSAAWRALEAPAIACEPLERADLAWLFYTSGTTGRPKGAMLTHGNLLAMAEGYISDVEPLDANRVLLHAAPMSHGSGLYLVPYLVAGALQAVPESGGFEADEVFALLRAHRGTGMFAAPTIVKRLVDRAAATDPDLSGLETLVYGGGPMYVADLRRALDVMGPRFAQIYGQGESPMTITALPKTVVNDRGHPRWLERIASVGRAQSGVEVAVRGEDGADLPPGTIGEVCVRGPVVMAGYWGNPEATRQALRDGWLRTGDLASFDEEGFLTLRDRSKDLIISGGANIYPREVEEALLAHPGVAEASVVGRPDAEWGETVVAFVVARGVPPTAQSLDAHCLERIARFKRPKEYRFVAALPKNHYGKVLKTELRAML